jgi:hypothetical protein
MDSLQAYNDSLLAAEEEARTLDSLRVVADSLETVVQDLRAAAADSAEIRGVEQLLERLRDRIAPPEPEPEAAQEEAEAAPAEPILPQREIYAILDTAVVPNETYRVTVTGVRNVNGLGGGGGEAEFTWEPPEPPDTAAVSPDTTAAPPDTTAAPPDTTAAPPDTMAAPPDTMAAPPDTTAAPPDTTAAPPDTTALLRPRIPVPWMHPSHRFKWP